MEAVASRHTTWDIDGVVIGGDFLILKEERVGVKSGEFFERVEVIFEGSSGQDSWSVGVVLGIREVVHDGSGSYVANGFEDGDVDVKLEGTKFHLSNSEHIGFERFLERLDQFFSSHCQSRKCSGLFDFLGGTKFKFDSC